MGINVWLSTVGRADLLRVMPGVIGVALVVLVVMIVDTQRRLWRLDAADQAARRRTTAGRVSA